MKRKSNIESRPEGLAVSHAAKQSGRHRERMESSVEDRTKNFVDLTGVRFGRLVVISFAGMIRNSISTWRCACDCGGIKITEGSRLKRGRVESCGCLAKELTSIRAKKHGMYGTSEYQCWINMNSRCHNPNHYSYARYGGVGISVCSRWRKSFDCFLSDMGMKTSKNHSIDRINGRGNYEPSNCRWATWKQQGENKISTKWITFNGRTQCETDWCKEFGIIRQTFRNRLKRGWDIERALTLKPIKWKTIK